MPNPTFLTLAIRGFREYETTEAILREAIGPGAGSKEPSPVPGVRDDARREV